MSIKNLSKAEALEAISAASESIDHLREYAKELDVTFSGNTGAKTLAEKLVQFVEVEFSEGGPDLGDSSDDEDIEVAKITPKSKKPTVAELIEMDPTKEPVVSRRREIIRAKALRLRRVQIVNLDPSDSAVTGGIYTTSNKYTGRVSKFIPFDPEQTSNGYHIPQILLDQLKEQTFVLRRQTKKGQGGIPQYTTKMVPKFSITILPDLTEEELKDLADVQRASQSIDQG